MTDVKEAYEELFETVANVAEDTDLTEAKAVELATYVVGRYGKEEGSANITSEEMEDFLTNKRSSRSIEDFLGI